MPAPWTMVAKLSTLRSRARRAAVAAATRAASRSKSVRRAEADHGHAPRPQCAAGRGVDDGDAGRLAGELAVGDQAAQLAAQGLVDGAGRASRAR